MQWLSLIASFLVGRLNNPHTPSLKDMASEILHEAAYKSRKPVAMILAGFVSVLILCGGFFMSVLDLTSQYDRNGFIQFSATLGAGLFLVVASLGAFAWVFQSAWPGARQHDEAEEQEEQRASEHRQPPVNGLEQALALLVMDFVKERERKRELKEEADHRETPLTPPVSVEPETHSLYN